MERNKERNDQIRWFYQFTDATRKEIGAHFGLMPHSINQITPHLKKAEKLIPFAHRNELKHKPVEVTTYPIPEANYSNRQPHPHNHHDYGLVPLNPRFGKRYVEGVKP